MEKKYQILTDSQHTITYKNRTLHRIQALRDFSDVKKGDIGGWIEKEFNLSQEGLCWIYNNAKVYDNAEVYNDAKILNRARVYGNAVISDLAYLCNDIKVYDNARIRGCAIIADVAVIKEKTFVGGKSIVQGESIVCGYATIQENSIIADTALVKGDTIIHGNAEISGNAVIACTKDYYVSKNIWSSGRYFTYTRSNRLWKAGCFHGTGKQLIEKAYKDSAISGREYQRIVEYVEAMYADLEKDTNT